MLRFDFEIRQGWVSISAKNNFVVRFFNTGKNFDFLEARFVVSKKVSQELCLPWLAYRLPALSCGRVMHR